MRLTMFPTSTILLAFLASLVCMITAEFEVLEYEWVWSRGGYVPGDSADFLTGKFIDGKEQLKLCRRVRTQLREELEKIHKKPTFGLFNIKLVQAENASPMNLLECPMQGASTYMKRIKDDSDDTSFVVYQKVGSGAGPSNAGNC